MFRSKEGALTKSDMAWLLIRLVGFYLLYAGIVGLITVFVVRSNLQETLSNLPARSKGKINMPIQGLFWTPLLTLGFGIYLTFRGGVIHHVMMSVPGFEMGSTAEIGTEAKSGLDEEEVKQFEAWLEANPTMEKRSPVDLIALFRDSQKAGDV